MGKIFQCGLVLLAAGASKRMGRPKQLLPINGVPLVRHVAELVLRAPVRPVVVVLGAHAREIRPALAGLPVEVVENPAWADGMATSLCVGVSTALKTAPRLGAVIVALADQPGLPDGHLGALIARFRQGDAGIIASRTGAENVPPILFGRVWFDRLVGLTGDAGARALLKAHPEAVKTVPLATNTDLDTPEDYARFTG